MERLVSIIIITLSLFSPDVSAKQTTDLQAYNDLIIDTINKGKPLDYSDVLENVETTFSFAELSKSKRSKILPMLWVLNKNGVINSESQVDDLVKLWVMLANHYMRYREYEKAAEVLSNGVNALSSTNGLYQQHQRDLNIMKLAALRMDDEHQKAQALCDLVLKEPQGGHNSEPNRVFMPAPVYPQKYHDKGLSGEVHIKYTVSECGEVKNVKLVEPVKARSKFRKESLRILKQAVYIPAFENGSAVITEDLEMIFTFTYKSNRGNISLNNPLFRDSSLRSGSREQSVTPPIEPQ